MIITVFATIAPFNAASAADHGVILAYHHVATDTPPSTSISPDDFRQHLQYLRDNDFNVLPLEEMVEALRNQQTLPDKSIAITFDDGYSSIYDTAFPMLQQYSFPFTLFVSTGPINDSQNGYMNWDQIRELSEAGVTIANHMVSHPYMLNREPDEAESEIKSNQRWLARLEEEIHQAEADIQLYTGQSHRYLAYPYGEYNPAIKNLLEGLGFTGFAQNSGAVGFNSDFLALPRFPLGSIYARLETASTKMGSKAFNVSLIEPASPVTTTRAPEALLQFKPGNYQLDRINCFADGDPLPLEWVEQETGLLKLKPEQAISGRRWRYICTAPAEERGRFYWYSVQWIKPD